MKSRCSRGRIRTIKLGERKVSSLRVNSVRFWSKFGQSIINTFGRLTNRQVLLQIPNQ